MAYEQCGRHDELDNNNFHKTPFPTDLLEGRAVYVLQVAVA